MDNNNNGGDDLQSAAIISSALDLSGEVRITGSAPVARGGYSWVYKGSFRREKVSVMFCLTALLTILKVAVKVIKVVTKDEASMQRVCFSLVYTSKLVGRLAS